MSYVDNVHKKNYVVTYKELVFIFVVFCVILFVLYPKDLLKDQILSEKSNYDLSMLYLKNLIEHEPENEELMLILAEQSLRTGKKDLSLRLLELLLESENEDYKNRATLLTYELKKDDYFYYKDKDKKAVEKEKLRKMFLNIMDAKLYSLEESKKWYEEALFFENYKYMYIFIGDVLAQDPNNIALIKQAYYISTALSHKNDSLKYIAQLAEKDSAQRSKWLKARYSMQLKYRLYNEAEVLLKKHSKNNIEWKNRYAEFSLMRKSYKKSSALYMELYNQTQGYTDKRAYFYKALNALQAGNYLKEASHLARKYEKHYISDADARKYILKLYMATGYLDYASSLSSKILKKEMQ